jgi:hypothetical protein
MARKLMLLALLAGIGTLGLAGCGDDDSGDDDADTGADADADTGADADADGDADAEADGPDVCDPACDPNDCEECVAGSCETTCDTDEACDGAGNCVAIPAGEIGSPCLTDADCPDGYCHTEFRMGVPGGYCATDCDAEGACDEGFCVTAGSLSFCAATCTGVGDCRAGYECVDLTDASVCWAACTDDLQCTSTTHCGTDTGFCSCPDGEHLNEEATDCIFNDCEFLACDTLNMDCNATGGCSGDCAACEGCNPPTYVESTNHCYPAGATWGGPCETNADCPGTGLPGSDTVCDPSGGGNCMQFNGPDFVDEGSPCTGDTGSVGIILYDMFGNPYEICAQGCTTDADCPAGLGCDATEGGVNYCWPIGDCNDSGCNDPSTDLYCAEDGACYADGCAADPCAPVADSTGECVRVVNDYRCVCDDGHIWNAETMACDAYTCPAVDLAPGDTESGLDLCSGTTQYDTGCTGWGAAGQELVYRLVVPAERMVEITMDATTFDAALWVTTRCEDVTGEQCVVGADAETEAAEVLALVNYETTAQTYYVIADSYTGCGTFDLTVTAAAPLPCGNGVVDDVAGESCDDGDAVAGDGCSDRCQTEFGWACDTTVTPSVCTAIPLIGSFAPAAVIPDQTGGPIAGGASAYYQITFTADVLLSGTFTGTAGSDPDVYILDATRTVASHAGTGTTETWTGDRLVAGTYVIRLLAYGSTAITTYTLTLSTTAAP